MRKWLFWLLPSLAVAAPASILCGTAWGTVGQVNLFPTEQCQPLSAGGSGDIKFLTTDCNCAFFATRNCSGEAAVASDHDLFSESGKVGSYLCSPKVEGVALLRRDNEAGVEESDKTLNAPTHSVDTVIGTDTTFQSDFGVISFCRGKNFKDCVNISGPGAVIASGYCWDIPRPLVNKVESLKMTAHLTCAFFPLDRCHGKARVIIPGSEDRFFPNLTRDTTIASYYCTFDKKKMKARDAESQPTEAKVTNLDPTIETQLQPQHLAGDVILFTETGFRGDDGGGNAMNKCLNLTPHLREHSKSLIQWKGAICTYFAWIDCKVGSDKITWSSHSKDLYLLKLGKKYEWLFASIRCEKSWHDKREEDEPVADATSNKDVLIMEDRDI